MSYYKHTKNYKYCPHVIIYTIVGTCDKLWHLQVLSGCMVEICGYIGHIDSNYCPGKIRHLLHTTCTLFHLSRSHTLFDCMSYLPASLWNRLLTDSSGTLKNRLADALYMPSSQNN